MARLDQEINNRGLSTSRERAKTLIKSGHVIVGGKVVRKPAFEVTDEMEILISSDADTHVSRAALKLEKALEVFDVSIDGLVCADIGASTGGFTEVLLGHGALKVYAIDVGTGQLSANLLDDNRVVNLEKTNFREIPKGLIEEEVSVFTMDVSFISSTLLADSLDNILSDEGEGVILIKPQFEAGRAAIGRNGIVKSKKDHIRVIEEVMLEYAKRGLFIAGLDYSPIKGGSGNIEYLAWLTRSIKKAMENPNIKTIVENAHVYLR